MKEKAYVVCVILQLRVDIDKPKHAALGSFVGPLVNSMQSVGQTSVVWTFGLS